MSYDKELNRLLEERENLQKYEAKLKNAENDKDKEYFTNLIKLQNSAITAAEFHLYVALKGELGIK